MSPQTVRLAIVLGLLSCVGPFAVDMMLPAMPAIAASLNTDPASAQIMLTSYFLAFGVSQLVWGPWSDAVGRKRPLYAGLAIFLVGSLGCAFAPTIEWLAAARFLQGLGAAVVMVVPRAIIRDTLTGTEATRLMAMVMLVISVSPMLAPLAGSAVIAFGSWHWIFITLALAALVSFALTATLLPETLDIADRVPVNLASLMRGTKTLLRSRSFMGLTFIGGFGMASFFVFIASASFVYSQQYGLSPTGFSIAFALNSIGFFGATQFAAGLGERFGLERMVKWAAAGFGLVTVTMFLVTLAGFTSFPMLVLMLIASNACLGLIIPSTMVMALDAHGEIAGLASSIGGTLQMLAGSLMVTLASPFFDSTSLPMTAAIAVCGVLAFTLSRLVLR
ncbi:MAG: multidrug effflux MFS transporter [Rhizobiaceae bacterium]|jgi:DHA1 family bicyclomycin/chloramphenicol resistance-like MFS transporter|nr:multidrug effflux MFS transporter [Rhizobiaceae bacterium]